MKKQVLLGAIGIILTSCTVTAAYINVGELDLDFCNGGNRLDIKMDAGTSTGFCVRLTNLSIKTGTVQIGLVDGEMSEGAHPVQACKTNADGIFGKSAVLHGESTFVLKPEESIVKTGTITLKTGFIGVMQGCTVFTILDDVNTMEQSGQMFSIITRKANTISVTVSGEVKTDVSFGQPSLTRNADGSYTFNLSLTNKGTVSTEINGSMNIIGGVAKDLTDRLGIPTIMPFNRAISLNTITVYPGDTKEITMQIAGLPDFGGAFTLNGDITYKPVVDATINLPGGTHQFATAWEYGLQKYGVRVLLAATLLALIILTLLFMLIIRFRSRKKKNRGGNNLAVEATTDIPAPKTRKKKAAAPEILTEDLSETAPLTAIKKTATRKKKEDIIVTTDVVIDPVKKTRTRKNKETTTE